jgi:hypothetical protein
MIAGGNGYDEVVSRLLEAGANVNFTENNVRHCTCVMYCNCSSTFS